MSRKDQGQELVHLLEDEDYLEEDDEENIQSVSWICSSRVSCSFKFEISRIKNSNNYYGPNDNHYGRYFYLIILHKLRYLYPK